MDEIIYTKELDTSAKFEKPSGLVTETVCAISGALPIEDKCKTTITEYFTKDTVPKDTCTVHLTVKLCDETHYKATKYCPKTTTYHYTISEDGTIELEDADFKLPDDYTETDCPEHTKKKDKHKSDKEDSPTTNNMVYKISTLVEGGGSIIGGTEIESGGSTTLMFIPNDGYVISNVTIDGVAQGAIYSYTFDSVTSNHSVVATFVPNTPTEAPPGEDVHDDSAYHQPSSTSLLSKLSDSLRTIFGIKSN